MDHQAIILTCSFLAVALALCPRRKRDAGTPGPGTPNRAARESLRDQRIDAGGARGGAGDRRRGVRCVAGAGADDPGDQLTRGSAIGRGLRTGRFTSPHLVSIRERIVVDGAPVSPERFVAAYEEASALLASLGHEVEDVDLPFAAEARCSCLGSGARLRRCGSCRGCTPRTTARRGC